MTGQHIDGAPGDGEDSLGQYLVYYQQLLEAERRKSAELPILYGHKAYSQNEEDGIILEILGRIGIAHRTFLEIGAGNGLENNTLFWLKQQWRGTWIDGDQDNVTFIRQAYGKALASGQLGLLQARISAGNIDSLVQVCGLAGQEIDILSIDIDGNDYYVFEKLESLNPRLVVIEYNARFPPPVRWRIPYREDYCWDGSDWFGASLQTMNDLFERRGYRLVACNITGSNAFFVRSDLVGTLFPLCGDVRALYQPARYFLTPRLFGAMMSGSALHVGLDCICD